MGGVRHYVHRTVGDMRSRPVTPHAALTAVERQGRDFALRFKLVDGAEALARFMSIRAAACAAHAYVGAPAPVVSLAADLIGWLFLFDDRFGEGGPDDDMRSLMARFASYESVMHGAWPLPEWTAFHFALRDIVERGLRIGGIQWRRRWACSMAHYFDGCVLELPYRRKGTAPGNAEYRKLRVWSVGTIACFDVLELGLPRVLSDVEAAQPDLVQARELAALLTAWVNDVYSFPKEQQAGDPMNLVAVLAKESRLSDDQAFAAAARVYNGDLAAFEAASREARRAAANDPIVCAYLQGLDNWIHGNHAWTATCGRYALTA